MQTIDDVPLILRREIEARIAVQLIEAFSKEFGQSATEEIAKNVMAEIARNSGRMMKDAVGGDTLEHLENGMKVFNTDNALDIETVEQSKDCLKMNIKHCKYAEMYKSLGLEKYGTILSCFRDTYLFEGFNPNIEFSREHTIMEGYSCCDFCMRLNKNE